MRRSMSWFAAAAVGIGCTHGASTGGDDAVVKPPPSILDVPTLSGGSEPVWIYVATPVGPGPYPVVIYGHGQGTDNVVNCTPDRAPDDGDAMTGEHIADALAGRGYLAISIFYRNRGAMIPAIGELRGRDHYILDARAFLAAAHLAHDQLGGDSRVALIGVSMGSFPATWAAAPLPELADLQAGLDIVTSIPTAMLGNQIGNTGRSKAALTTGEAFAFAGLASVDARSAIALDPSLTAVDLAGTEGEGLTAVGKELVRRVFLDAPDPTLAGCAATEMPVACSDTCVAATFDAIAAAHGISGVAPADWLTQDTIDAIDYWSPPDAIDPGAATSNTMLADQRSLSPAYTLSGPLRAKRIFPLVSTGDHVVTTQLANSNAPAQLYIDRLQSTGVTIPSPVPVVQDSTCDHGNYLDPTRPQCGWSLVLAELTTAFD